MPSLDTRTDAAVLAAIGDRLAAARLSRNRTQADLAREAGVSKRTLERMEAGESAQLTSFLRVLRALDLLDGLDALLPPARLGPIALLERSGRTPKRASPRADERTADRSWHWGRESS
jgi:transcriptional regulator with XRE-family HTH domain